MTEAPRDWHLDKRVPIGLILAIILQTVALAWWGASLSAKVEENERRVGTLERFKIARIRDERDHHARMARIDGSLEELTRGMTRLDPRLDGLARQWGILNHDRGRTD